MSDSSSTGDAAILTGAAEALAEAAARVVAIDGANESDLRHRLFLVLGPFVLDHLGLLDSDVRQEGSGKSGRYDSIFGRAIVEYKSPGVLDTEGGREAAGRQAIGYLDDPSLGAQIVIVTDGKVWGILRDPEAGAEPGEQTWLDLGLDATSLPAAQRFAWRSNGVEACERVLNLITTVKSAPVKSDTVIERLGPRRTEVGTLISLLADRLGSRAEDDRTSLLLEQWVRLAGVAYGIEDVDAPWPASADGELGLVSEHLRGRSYAEAIFTLHTYVGLACKLVACELLALREGAYDSRPSQWAALSAEDLAKRIRSVESGHITDDLGAPGLFAGDVFGWYSADLEADSELSAAVRGLVVAVSELAWAKVANAEGIASDLLRDLYQAVVPSPLRKALGEFFTPRWLAERLLIRSIQLASDSDIDTARPRILDPTCGSGTFLVAALRYGLAVLQEDGLQDDPAEIEGLLSRIVGFDINPVSVLMARVNLLLTLGDRAQLLAEFAPKVFETDSLLIPSSPDEQLPLGGSGDALRITTAAGDMYLHQDLCTLEGIAALRANIEAGVERGRDPELFRDRLAGELRHLSEPDEALESATAVYIRVLELASRGKNGVWARVIEQSFAPLLAADVDIVVGNPPWVSWKNLPDRWKADSKPLWSRYGLWQTTRRKGGIPLSDISTLVVARSVETYCPRGVVALLLPLSAQIADPGGREFRKCRLKLGGGRLLRFRPLLLEDFSSLKPFSPDAQNEPIALFLSGGAGPQYPFPRVSWSRKVPRSRIDPQGAWSQVGQHLSAADGLLAPLHEDDQGSPWAPPREPNSLELLTPDAEAAYEWGRGFETRGLDGLFFVRTLTESPVGSSKLVRVQNLPDIGRNTASEEPIEGLIEPAALLPLMKGEQLKRWRVERENIFCIALHDFTSGGEVMTISRVLRQLPKTYDYVEGWIPRFRGRSLYRSDVDGTRPWGLSGPAHHFDPESPYVAVRYISAAPEAAVVEPTAWPRLGRTVVQLPNNKTNFIATSSGDEAHYICAWINSDPAQSALARFSAVTGVTPRALRAIPIPKFDAADVLHNKLVALSREAHQAVPEGTNGERLGEIEEEVATTVLAIHTEAQ